MSLDASEPTPLVTAQTRAAMMLSVVALERSVKERRDREAPLLNWWVATFILSPLTANIYGLVMWFKMVIRVNEFRRRRRDYYEAVIDFSARYADAAGKLDVVRDDLRRLELDGCEALDADVHHTNPWLALILSIVTLGIWSLVVVYRLNKAWYTFQVIEQEFDDRLSQVWLKLGLARYPLTFTADASKKRNFGLYLFLSVITLGIWTLVWSYKLYTDPDSSYAEFHSIEDMVLQTARAA